MYSFSTLSPAEGLNYFQYPCFPLTSVVYHTNPRKLLCATVKVEIHKYVMHAMPVT